METWYRAIMNLKEGGEAERAHDSWARARACTGQHEQVGSTFEIEQVDAHVARERRWPLALERLREKRLLAPVENEVASPPTRPVRPSLLAAISLDSSCSTASPMSMRGTKPERWMGVRSKMMAVGRLLAVPHPETTVSSFDGALADDGNGGEH